VTNLREVVVSTRAAHEIGDVPHNTRERVRVALEKLAHWPDVSGCHRLRHQLEGLWRMRVGDHRIVFRVDETGPVQVESIGPRESVYFRGER